MKSSTIMIVEDEPLAGMEIQENLIRAGYDVPGVVSKVDHVLPALVKYRPDLVLMDINLGGFTDGVDAVKRMKVLGNTPVVYLTAYGDKETKKRAMQTGAVSYLIKPVSEAKLKSVISEILGE